MSSNSGISTNFTSYYVVKQANQLQSQCPSNERLADIIKKRNSIVRQLNNIYLIIATNTALAFLFTYLSTFFTFISDKIASLSFPVAVGGVGVPYSIISRLENNISLFSLHYCDICNYYSIIYSVLFIFIICLSYCLILKKGNNNRKIREKSTVLFLSCYCLVCLIFGYYSNT